MSKITAIKAREILDSQGMPTVETEVWLDDGFVGVASVPSGTSKGKYEAIELRDNDPDRFCGQGVLKAVENVNRKIAPKIIGENAEEQDKIDQILIDLDGTENKENLGANAILSVSQGVLEAAAASHKMPIYDFIWKKYQLANKETRLPTPTFNIINGGKHGSGNLDFQEFHIIPSGRASYHSNLQEAEEIYQALKNILIQRGASYAVGAESGFTPDLFSNGEGLEVITEAIKQTKYKLGLDVFLGLDPAASFFYKDDKYHLKDQSQPLSREDLINYYLKLNGQYHLYSLEDGLEENDWEGWQLLTANLRQGTLIVGDDLLSTNKERVEEAIKKQACTAILVKPNQIGTISETLDVIRICKKSGWKIIVSHRSGETNDDFIADFAIGVGADYTKFGAPARGERVAKYNRLLKIEEEIQSQIGSMKQENKEFQ